MGFFHIQVFKYFILLESHWIAGRFVELMPIRPTPKIKAEH